jgi:dGTP triphosphohydrolase
MNFDSMPLIIKILSITQMICGIGVALGGLLWILVFFLPYLLEMRRMQIEALNLARQALNNSVKLQQQFNNIENDAKPVLETIKEISQEVNKIIHDLKERDVLNKIEIAVMDIQDSMTRLSKAFTMPIVKVKQDGKQT